MREGTPTSDPRCAEAWEGWRAEPRSEIARTERRSQRRRFPAVVFSGLRMRAGLVQDRFILPPPPERPCLGFPMVHRGLRLAGDGTPAVAAVAAPDDRCSRRVATREGFPPGLGRGGRSIGGTAHCLPLRVMDESLSRGATDATRDRLKSLAGARYDRGGLVGGGRSFELRVSFGGGVSSGVDVRGRSRRGSGSHPSRPPSPVPRPPMLHPVSSALPRPVPSPRLHRLSPYPVLFPPVSPPPSSVHHPPCYVSGVPFPCYVSGVPFSVFHFPFSLIHFPLFRFASHVFRAMFHISGVSFTFHVLRASLTTFPLPPPPAPPPPSP